MEYAELTRLYELLTQTTKRLQKTKHLSDFLKGVSQDELPSVILLLQGLVFPSYDERKLGLSTQLLLKAINTATGVPPEKIAEDWKTTGDLGETAEKSARKKQQVTLFTEKLTVAKVFANLQKIATLEGEGTVDRKIQLIAELMTAATPTEAKYLSRTILGELRIGLGEGTLRDALVWAYACKVNYDLEQNELIIQSREEYDKIVETVQEALDIANDFCTIAQILRNKGISGLNELQLELFRPLKSMLYQKATDLQDAFSIVGRPAAFEYKYDGFRLQIHKKNDEIVLFTRRLERVTSQFPDVVKVVKENITGNVIIDAEVVGIKDGKYLPFQNISQRIKRKYDIRELAEKFPVEVNCFDIVYSERETLLKKAFSERRKILESVTHQQKGKLTVAQQIITDDDETAAKFYKESLAAGNEGVMAKNLSGIYKPGSRVGYGVKVKPTLETFDVVIVSAEWGEGKRSKWLSSYEIAVRGGNGFLVVGRVATGLKEKDEEGTSFNQLTEILKPLILDTYLKEVVVKPEIIIEVDYEEIQKSPTYASGYALRFPRFVRLRPDKNTTEITTIEQVKEVYEKQRGRDQAA